MQRFAGGYGYDAENGLLPSYGSLEKGSNRVTSSVFRKAVQNTLVIVFFSCVFGTGLYFIKGKEKAMEFFAGYIVEQSLSIDNLFVFIMLFDFFHVPIQFQSKILTWGIIGAVVMRGIMIFLGVAAISHFRVVALVFAGILIMSAYKLFRESFEGSNDDEDLENNFVIKLTRKMFKCSNHYDGDRFFTSENGQKIITPLLMCLICIELSDFVFAVDSIPAVLGVTHDTLIVYSSNIFAIAGLRSLYTLLAEAVQDLPYLKPAVAVVLGFVGGKMIGEYMDYNVSTFFSLVVVVCALTGGVLLSLFLKKGGGDKKYHRGAAVSYEE